jgi:hypothetical protein
MFGTGIMALADYLDLPEIYQSYGDTNVDRLTNPDLYADTLVRAPGNALLDAATFIGDLAGDIPGAVVDQFASADYYNPFTQEGMERNTLIPGIDFQNIITDRGKDTVSALINEFTGLPSLTIENPMMDESLSKNLMLDTQATIDSKYEPEFQNIADDAYNYVDSVMPSFSTFAVNNPNKTIADYKAMEDEMFTAKFDELYDSNLSSQYMQDLNNLASQSSINKFGYNIFDSNVAVDDLVGPGLRKFDLGNIKVPGLPNLPLKYAAEGEYVLPFMEYEGPEKERLQDLSFAMELGGGFGIPLAKRFLRKGMKKQDRISPDLQDAVNEYMRD